MKALLARLANLKPRLFWQISIAFIVIILLLGGGMLLAWRFSWEQFGPAVEVSSLVRRACLNELADYYAAHENWEGAVSVLTARPCLHGWGFGEHNPHKQDVLLLATDEGLIVAASGAQREGQALTEQEMAQTVPVISNNRLVGLLYSDKAGPFNSRFSMGFLWMGGVLVGVSLLVGLVFSRRISSPIANLIRASQAMAAGNLYARVPVRGRGEVRDLALAFNQMADQVEETIFMLSHFVSDAAHEINTPLTALRTNLELAPQDEAVLQALTQAHRLETLASGLLDLSHIEGGAAQEAHTSVSLSALLEELSELYASRAEQAGLEFVLTLPDAPLMIPGDVMQLRRAVGNVLDNAIKFTPKGGRVALTLQQVKKEIVITVEDTGIGIPEEDLPYIFGRFHRGRNANTYPGNGLGLAIVKAILAGHGGQVDVEPVEPGIRVTLRLLPRGLPE